MKEINDLLKYILKGKISSLDTDNGIVTVIKGKSVDDININDFINDIKEWFDNRKEDEEIDLTLVAKIIKK